jgi:hypothetical protein
MIGIARISRPWALVVLLRLPTGTRPILSKPFEAGELVTAVILAIARVYLSSGYRAAPFAVVVLVPFEERLHVLRRDQTNIVSKRCELTGDVMRSRTRFHADQAARNIGEPALKLSARAFELPNDRAALVETDWKLFFPRSIPIVLTAAYGADLCDMGRAPCASRSLHDFTSCRAGARPGHPISGCEHMQHQATG